MWDIIELAGMLALPMFLLLDLVWRDRRFDAPGFWKGRAALVTWGNVALSGWIAAFWSRLFADRSLFNFAGLGAVGGAVAGVLTYEFIHYGYHRLAHGWTPLWRTAHQMHHSAESIDAFGAFYLHPVDNFFFTTWSSLVFFPLLGVSLEAGLLGSVFITLNAILQHANVRTPRWLGYIVQRPESHRLHHARGVHRFNYADLPLIDMIFGTFKNPARDPGLEEGFWKGASSKILSMLVFRDVSEPPRTGERVAARIAKAA